MTTEADLGHCVYAGNGDMLKVQAQHGEVDVFVTCTQAPSNSNLPAPPGSQSQAATSPNDGQTASQVLEKPPCVHQGGLERLRHGKPRWQQLWRACHILAGASLCMPA